MIYSEIMRVVRRIVVLLGLLATLVFPAVALAGNQSATLGDGGGAQGALSGGGEGTLPFTGLNLVLIVLAGIALIGTGVLLRRRSGSGAS
jgi:hypothetical protein